MIRKQIYITPRQDSELKIRARVEGSSVAKIIRDSLSQALKIRDSEENPASVLTWLAENTFDGPSDLSSNLFDYLYGDKSPNYGKNAPRLTKKEIEHANRFINDHKPKKNSG